MSRSLHAAFVFVALALLATAASTRAQPPATSASDATAATAPATDARFTGHYRFAESPEAGQRRVIRAVQPILRSINPIFRPLAESRLRETYVPARIDLTVRGQHVAVRYVGREEEHTFRSRAGYPRTITRDSGQAARMTQLFRDGQLQQIFEGDQGGRWYNLFALDASAERLTLRVVVTHERLTEPIRVELPYVRIP